jgi:hypothetical protein
MRHVACWPSAALRTPAPPSWLLPPIASAMALGGLRCAVYAARLATLAIVRSAATRRLLNGRPGHARAQHAGDAGVARYLLAGRGKRQPPCLDDFLRLSAAAVLEVLAMGLLVASRPPRLRLALTVKEDRRERPGGLLNARLQSPTHKADDHVCSSPEGPRACRSRRGNKRGRPWLASALQDKSHAQARRL